MNIVELQEIPAEVRAELARSDPSASFFHMPAWTDALVRSYDYFRPAGFAALDRAGRPAGMLPAILSTRFGLKQLLSLPYGTYGGPIAVAESREERAITRNALVDAWRAAARRPGVVRAHLVLGDEDDGIAQSLSGRRSLEQTFLLDLRPGWDVVWNESFAGEARTAARKAEKLGVTVTEETNEAGAGVLDALYRGLAAAWSNHTPFPRTLFRNVIAAAPDTARIWTARHEDEPVAAQLVLHHRDTALSWIAANTLTGRKVNAQNLLYARVIEDACRRGAAVFNFGGAGGSASLRNFKIAFGGREIAYAACLVEAPWFRPLHRIQYRLRGIDG